MIYLDNAATTFRKPHRVVRAVKQMITKYSANPGRGGHKLSLLAGEKVLNARLYLNQFFNGFGAENCIFTANCTESLNLALLGTVKQGGHVITSALDHNSVLRPLEKLKDEGKITYSVAMPSKSGNIGLSEIKKLVKPNTYLIAVCHSANTTGAINRIKEIGKFAKTHNIMFLVDSAQSAGHEKIDMHEFNIDMLALPSHKGIMGIAGAGALLFNPRVKINPIKFGGTGTSSSSLTQPSDAPEAYESGTVSTPAIHSMHVGAKFIENKLQQVKQKEAKFSEFLINRLKQNKKVKVYSSAPSSTVLFNIGNIPSSEIALILSEQYNICVRDGLHCAPLAHQYLGTLKQGAIRASFSYYTKFRHVKKLADAVEEICKNLEA